MRAVDDLDVSIRQIRSTIFELHQRWATAQSLRGEIVAICDESAKALGFTPSCDISGPIDSAVVEPTRGPRCCCAFAKRCRTSLDMPGPHASTSQ